MPSELLTALRLAKEGFGTVEGILAMPADLALAAADFSGFIADYRDTVEEMNKNG